MFGDPVLDMAVNEAMHQALNATSETAQPRTGSVSAREALILLAAVAAWIVAMLYLWRLLK